MVKYKPALDAVFSALADPTRRAILGRLARGEASVSELAEPFRMSLPAVSKHLRILRRAGLVVRRKDGRVHRCRLEARPLKDAARWIAYYRTFWAEQLDALVEYLDEMKEKEARSWPPQSTVLKTPSMSDARSPRAATRSLRRGPRRKRS